MKRTIAVLTLVAAFSAVGLTQTSRPEPVRAEERLPIAVETPEMVIPASETPAEVVTAPAPSADTPVTCQTGYTLAEDMTCVPPGYYDEPATPVVYEDDPAWDCRVMGNRECGVQIGTSWYVVTFDGNGQPIGVRAS